MNRRSIVCAIFSTVLQPWIIKPQSEHECTEKSEAIELLRRCSGWLKHGLSRQELFMAREAFTWLAENGPIDRRIEHWDLAEYCSELIESRKTQTITLVDGRTLKSGDVVAPKLGGQLMVIEKIVGAKAFCRWECWGTRGEGEFECRDLQRWIMA